MTSARRGLLSATLLLVGCSAFATVPPSSPAEKLALPTGSVVPPELPAVQPQVIRLKPLTAEQLSRHSVKVAAVQITGTWLYPFGNSGGVDPADAVVDYIGKVAKDGVDLVAFPELYLGMYKLPHPSTDKIAAAAREHKIYVVVGMMEMTESGDHFNSSLIFDRQGELVGRYNKTHAAIGEMPYLWPPVPNDPEWVFTEGSEFPVFDLDFGRVGIVTCYDGYFPEPWRILSLKGAEIIIWMNARGGSIEDYMVRTHMAAGVTHVMATNKAIGAGTMIGRWPGQIAAELKEAKEGYISADLPLMLLRNARRNDRQLIQRRPWIYSEILNHYDVAAAYAGMDLLPGAPPDSFTVVPVGEGLSFTATGGSSAPAKLAFLLSGFPGEGALTWSRVAETGELTGTATTSAGDRVQIYIYPRRDLIHAEVSVTAGAQEVQFAPAVELDGATIPFAVAFEGGAAPTGAALPLRAVAEQRTIAAGEQSRVRFRIVPAPTGEALSKALQPRWEAWAPLIP
jgi:predicted amidohydrolase